MVGSNQRRWEHMRAPLIDRFGRCHTYLRVSVTDRCNLGCCYCRPHDGISFSPKSSLLSFEEIYRIIFLLAEMGVTKVRLTGGEPLMRRSLDQLIQSVSCIPGIQRVCMTTNGVLLAQHAKSLKDNGLSSVNISMDTLRPDRFVHIARHNKLQDVLSGIDAAIRASFDSIKLNMVVMGGINDDEILQFIEFVRFRRVDLRYIEFMPFKSNSWNRGTLVPSVEIRRRIREHYDLTSVPHSPNGTSIADEYQIPGIQGKIGFISSMSEEFCDTCSRLRLMADGEIKTCLFGPVAGNLRDAMRSGADDDELETLLRSWIELKGERHAPMEDLEFFVQAPMITIGG
jgi:molybdenum cofactor biosynthesis protein A